MFTISKDRLSAGTVLVMAVLLFALDSLGYCGYSVTGILISIAMVVVMPGCLAIIAKEYPLLWSLAPGIVGAGVDWVVETFVRKSGFDSTWLSDPKVLFWSFVFWFVSANVGLTIRRRVG